MSDPEAVPPAPVPDPASFPEPPQFSGPEIPGNVINERGFVTVVKDDLDWYESARVEFCTEPLFAEEEPIAWLWPGRIPLGLVTVIEGGVSVGKSPLAADMIARVTRGAAWPGQDGGPQPAGDVLLVCGELGGWPKMTLPRLKLAGADLGRIARLEEIQTREAMPMQRERSRACRPLRFPHDLPHVEYWVRARPETRLVVIDPLAMYCPDARAWRETLRKLHEIAARRNVAIVVVTGRGGRASVRSRFRVEADSRSDEVRALFNVLEDAEDEALRFFAPARMSFCALPKWLAFRIVGGRVVWQASVSVPPDEALPSRPGTRRGGILREVIAWMQRMLQKKEVPVKEAEAQARALGYSKMTVRRAREHLGVRTVRRDGRCWWTLAEESKGSNEESKGSKSNGAPVAPRRAPDESPGIAPRVDPAPPRLQKPRRDRPERDVPQKPSRAAKSSDWRHFREALLEELNIAEALSADPPPVEPPFVVPPSGGTPHGSNGKPSSKGKHSFNGRHDSNGDGDSTGKRPKPR